MAHISIDLNLSNNAPQPQPRFLHANDDLTSEIRYTARGRFMSCLPCTFVAPSLHSSAANQRSNLAQVLPTRFTLVSSPNIIAASGQQKLMLESGTCGPPLRWAWL